MRERRIVLSILAGLAMGTAITPAFSQARFPSQPVKLIVPYPAGGGTDFFARTVAQGMSEVLGQSVIVENRPGASGLIAGAYVAKQAPADGHTVLWGDMTTYAVNSTLLKRQQQYDILKDFDPVTKTAKFNFVLVVNPKVLDVKSVQELLEAAKRSKDGLNYGNPSIGTTHHLATEMFARETGAKLVGITYKGGGAAVQDLLGGQFGMMFLDRATAKPHIDAGKLRPLAVAGATRTDTLPGVPTVAEAGVKGYNVEGWQGIAVRAGTPPAAIKALADAYAKAIEAPGMKQKLADAGIDVTTSTPQEFFDYVRSETQRWGQLIEANGIKAE